MIDSNVIQNIQSLMGVLDKDTIKEMTIKQELHEKSLREPILNGSLKISISKIVTGKMKNLLKKVNKLYPKTIEQLVNEELLNKGEDIKYTELAKIISDKSDYTVIEVFEHLKEGKQPENELIDTKIDIFYLEFLKVFLLVDGLKPEEVEMIQSDVSTNGVINDFWNEFDMIEVKERVNFFRLNIKK